MLRTLAQDNSLPWCVMGDFNDLLSNEEKRSRVDHPPWRIRGFREAVQDSGLIDIHMTGYPFTWVKGRGGHDMKEERIDRAMATQTWCDIFHQNQLHNVISHRSDHFPILLKLQEVSRRRGGKEFKFENAWLMEDELNDIVIRGWERCQEGEVLSRLRSCTEFMNEWGASKGSCIEQLLRNAEKRWRDFGAVFKALRWQDMRKHEQRWGVCWHKKKLFGSRGRKFTG